MVKMLVEAGADVQQRASGKFFLPKDQKDRKEQNQNQAKKETDTNYEGKRETSEAKGLQEYSFIDCLLMIVIIICDFYIAPNNEL